nr:dehydrogenase/reductase SDR family member on chromosome X isoform X1 [Tanacetum cinerariifolium]
MSDIIRQNKEANVEDFQVDLLSFSSIMRFKESIEQWLLDPNMHPLIQLLINNAGRLATTSRFTTQGYDDPIKCMLLIILAVTMEQTLDDSWYKRDLKARPRNSAEVCQLWKEELKWSEVLIKRYMGREIRIPQRTLRLVIITITAGINTISYVVTFASTDRTSDTVTTGLPPTYTYWECVTRPVNIVVDVWELNNIIRCESTSEVRRNTSSSSQTTDVLIKGDQTPGRYYSAARAYASAPNAPFNNTTTTAILEYKTTFNDTKTITRAFSKIHSTNHAMRELIQSLLVRIGQTHPQLRTSRFTLSLGRGKQMSHNQMLLLAMNLF